MKKQLFFTTVALLFSVFSFGQTNNETLGTGAGSSITSGDNNVILGDNAGTTLTSGSNNVFVGREAGFSQTSAFDNIFIGKDAGRSNVTGTDNIFIGVEAGLNNTATDNIFIGTEAGELNTSGADNVFIGEESGTNNTTGNDNVFIGEDAGFNNTTANDNTFVGNTAGRLNTEGFRNTYVGNEAGYDSSTGYRNTYVGDSTGIDNSIGRLNTFIGQAAGSANEYSNYNTFVGAQSGGDNNRTNSTTNANRNTYVGVFSGFSNREGEDNVGMGAFANYNQGFDILNITGKDGATTSSTPRFRNTFIGAQSHPNNNDVIAIGYRSRVDGQFGITIGNESTAQGNYSVAIGQNVTVAQPNSMALGGDTVSNRLSVGIGTVSANGNASLTLADTDKGFLVNRLTTAQRTAMVTAGADGTPLDVDEAGLLVYDTDVESLFIWNGTAWTAFGSNTDAQELSLASNTLSITGSAATVDLSPYVNTDNQELSLSSNTLSITGSASTIDLSGYVSSDDQNLTAATLSGGNVLTIEIEGGSSVFVDLNPIIEDLEMENDNQQLQINDLLTRVTTLEGCACTTLSVDDYTDDLDEQNNRASGPILYQNIPNPFNGTTSIKYFVPNSYNKAAIVFSNTSGQVIDNVPLENLGDQEIFFNSDSLASGMYYYTLFVDGRKIDTKKMVIE
ncbi:T9SS type A sorting domain-containing protein [Olleya sp. YS]|uniref:T9SS type A sorting domain-containing protein n=1 Tax=Olleya sp. YS TaxID=3028318 RepID=UPI0024342728|nr:T9SS type A sorting domain-containing protein [Olleya sp. YS]WGD34308.1 T9SS type A sorting domain-containing protein [Olleya sp. YS]